MFVLLPLLLNITPELECTTYPQAWPEPRERGEQRPNPGVNNKIVVRSEHAEGDVVDRLSALDVWESARAVIGYNNQPKSAAQIREANLVSSLIESQTQE